MVKSSHTSKYDENEDFKLREVLLNFVRTINDWKTTHER